jgi:hypothetical protein
MTLTPEEALDRERAANRKLLMAINSYQVLFDQRGARELSTARMWLVRRSEVLDRQAQCQHEAEAKP